MNGERNTELLCLVASPNNRTPLFVIPLERGIQ